MPFFLLTVRRPLEKGKLQRTLFSNVRLAIQLVLVRAAVARLKRMSPRRHKAVNILVGVFDGFLMVLEISVVDFLSHAASVPLAQHVAGVSSFGVGVVFQQVAKKNSFSFVLIVIVIRLGYKSNFSGRQRRKTVLFANHSRDGLIVIIHDFRNHTVHTFSSPHKTNGFDSAFRLQDILVF